MQNSSQMITSEFSYAQVRVRHNWRSTMSHLVTKVKRFFASEDGPTAVEYAVMLALIVVVCLGAITTLGTKARTTYTNVSNKI